MYKLNISAGTYSLEEHSLLWTLNEVCNSEAKQEFMSLKFNPQKLAIIHKLKGCLKWMAKS